ncbi:MAG: hypothetical protein FWB73_03770 [Treponema sp.]|nr:hypothetical protein [Treponema sp.]
MADDYSKIVNSLKRRSKGATAADICALTALPLSTVNELLPKAADEFRGHLRVTQSGEILYYFPNGFSSRYRGLGAFLRKAAGKTVSFIKKALPLLFKIWIMVMLVGYFVLFLAIALASVFISIAAKSGSRDSGGSGDGGFGGLGLFELLIRIWFYSEIMRPSYDDYDYKKIRKKKEKRPLHKAVFSFVFGEEDPNKNWEENTLKAVISFVQANKGCITLPEYMMFTGEKPLDAEKNILAFCSKYGGRPEVTEEGAIVYQFDDILLRSQTEFETTGKFAELSPLVRRLKIFSSNSKKMNIALILINAFNLIFGSYFLFNSISTGQLLTELQFKAASKIYGFVYYFLDMIAVNPHILIGIILGVIPLAFSVFFWLIPSIRYFSEKKENEEEKFKNLKRFCFGKIWSSPNKVDIKKINHPSEEFTPKNLEEAEDKIIKEIGAVSIPEVETDEKGNFVYSFKHLEREKQALEKFRASIDADKTQIGKTVFDSGD